jgi:hypothetical protein
LPTKWRMNSGELNSLEKLKFPHPLGRVNNYFRSKAGLLDGLLSNKKIPIWVNFEVSCNERCCW